MAREEVMSFQEFFARTGEIKEYSIGNRTLGWVLTGGGAIATGLGAPRLIAAAIDSAIGSKLYAGIDSLPKIATTAGIIGIGVGVHCITKSNSLINACDEAQRIAYENGVPCGVRTSEDVANYIGTIAAQSKHKEQSLTRSIYKGTRLH